MDIRWLFTIFIISRAAVYLTNYNHDLKPIENQTIVKKGTTFQSTIFPNQSNNWVGRFSCNGCNPLIGDTFCNMSLPILCICFPKALQRPYYRFLINSTSFSVSDNGFYEGWTGGVFKVTDPVFGSDITTYEYGDGLCKDLADNAKFATFNDGYYMENMNQQPMKTQGKWNWDEAKPGGWNYWGYFNLHYRGRVWIWVNQTLEGNCAIPPDLDS